MADRGRDLKISILSDADRFDLSHPAEELDDMATAASRGGTALDKAARAAKDTGTDLGTLGTDATTAAGKIDTLGTDATTTAGKVDSAFDAIAKSSKQKLGGGMETGSDKAKRSLKDVGDEASGTARETAASFDGTASSVNDAMQEVAANALGAFGPIAGGICLAAAAGFGFLRAQAEKTKETISELVGSLIDQNGKLEDANVLESLKKFAQDGSLRDLKRQAQDAKVPVSDFLLAMAGDPAAMARSTAAVAANRAELALANEGATEIDQTSLDLTHNLSGVSGALAPVAENYAIAAEAAALYKSTTDGVAEAQAAFNESLAGFTDPMAAFTDALPAMGSAEQKAAKATADASKDMSDSWEDYAENVDVSVDEYLTSLEKQVKAQVNWEKNMTTLAGKVSAETLEELAKLGPEGAPLVAKLVNASDTELVRMNGAFRTRAEAAGGQFAAGLAAKKEEAAAATRLLAAAAQKELNNPLVMNLQLNTTQYYKELRKAGISPQIARQEARLRP